MNLVKQFSDISGRIRAKVKFANKPVHANRPLPYDEDPGVAAYYEGQFRRGHVKVVVTIAAGLAMIYFALLNSKVIMNYLRLVNNG